MLDICYKFIRYSFGPFLIYTNGTALNFAASSAGTAWDVANLINIGTITTSIWYYVEVCRIGTTIYTFLNGVAGATAVSTLALYNNSAYPVVVGAYGAVTTYPWSGYIDDVEIYKGVGGHSTTYTPPTAEFIDIPNSMTGSTEPTWNLSGTTVEGAITYTHVDTLVDGTLITAKIPTP